MFKPSFPKIKGMTCSPAPLTIGDSEPIPPSAIQVLDRLRITYNFTVDLDGTRTKLLTGAAYKTIALKLSALILIAAVVSIIKQYTYHPITILGHTIYARTIIETVAASGSNFAVCKGPRRFSYYETTNGSEIAFEGFSPLTFEGVQIEPQPLDPAALASLERHTRLRNLAVIQGYHFSHHSTVDRKEIKNALLPLPEVPSKDPKSESFSSIPTFYGPAVSVKKFVGDLYYVTTHDHIWITRRVLTDGVHPLQPGDIISSLIPDRFDLYQMGSDFLIHSIGPDRKGESLIYSLKIPRPFETRGVIPVHPFHLPPSADPLTSLILVTRALLCT
jgi:hypothetical protein